MTREVHLTKNRTVISEHGDFLVVHHRYRGDGGTVDRYEVWDTRDPQHNIISQYYRKGSQILHYTRPQAEALAKQKRIEALTEKLQRKEIA